MSKILKIYIAHQGTVDSLLDKIKEDVIVAVGGQSETKLENGILKLKCDDTYCGLPDKMVTIFKYVSESPELAEYTHIYKLDEDMVFVKDIDFELTDYMGEIGYKETINRSHHIGRCPGHYWNDKPFEGEIYNWCGGGSGYIISRKAFEIVAKYDGTKYPLEDVMIASILGSHGIYATNLNIGNYYQCMSNHMGKIKGYNQLKGRVWKGPGIPKWIIKTGSPNRTNLSSNVIDLYLGILNDNPGYELFYFSDLDCEDFILEEWGQYYLDLYNRLIPTAYKADFWRYLLLYKYGGCYGDFTQKPLIPYDELIQDVDRVVVRDDPSGHKGYLYNALIYCKAEDPMIKKAIDICIYNIEKEYYGIDCLSITGPAVLGQAFKQAGLNKVKMIYDISLGTYKRSRVLQHRWEGAAIMFGERQALITKLDFHWGILYVNKKHYGAQYAERTVFKK